jgi:hypothetical protein
VCGRHGQGRGKLPPGQGLIQKLLKDADSARWTATNLKFHPGETIESPDFYSSIGEPGIIAAGAEFVLARGAAELIAELLRRFPVTGPDEKLMGWFRSAQRLGRSISKLGLWHQLMSDPVGRNLGRMADMVSQGMHRSAFFSSPFKDAIDEARQRFGARELLPLLFCGSGISWPWPLRALLTDTQRKWRDVTVSCEEISLPLGRTPSTMACLGRRIM